MAEIIRNTGSEPNSVYLIERTDGKKEICGYGAIFYTGSPGSEHKIGENLFERFQKGCFDSAVASGSNIQIRYNHSADFILGDTDSDATVSTDDKGIKYSVPFDASNPDHQKVAKGIGKWIKGSSIGAYNPTYRFDVEGGKHIAWVTDLEVIRDLSPVNSPAYKNAPAMMRSSELDEQYTSWLKAKAETDKRINKYR
jgi:HK97 family phage prohead protease